jgi:hypothetical protein
MKKLAILIFLSLSLFSADRVGNFSDYLKKEGVSLELTPEMSIKNYGLEYKISKEDKTIFCKSLAPNYSDSTFHGCAYDMGIDQVVYSNSNLFKILQIHKVLYRSDKEFDMENVVKEFIKKYPFFREAQISGDPKKSSNVAMERIGKVRIDGIEKFVSIYVRFENGRSGGFSIIRLMVSEEKQASNSQEVIKSL